jgi:GAF domain-containing protein
VSRLAEVFANALTRQRADREIQELKERLEAENVELRLGPTGRGCR